MLVDIPVEWKKYFTSKPRTFKKDTPEDIIREAKEVNKITLKSAGKPFYFFEGNED